MIKSIGRFLISLLVITIIGIGGLWIYTQNKTFLNDENEVGNTAGNIYNGGLFVEQDGSIYFSNEMDQGSLYVTDSNLLNFKKVHNDKAVFINVDENYIYYVRANNTRGNNAANILMYNNTGIYRIKQNGTDLKVVSHNPGAYLTLKGNHLYYQKYDVEKGLFLHRNAIDCSEEKLLFQDAVIPASIIDNTLYFAGYSKDHNLNSLDLRSFNDKIYLEGTYLYPIFHGDYLYYINIEDNYKIYRSNIDGTNPTLLVDRRCSTYNITNSGKYLYYQVDNGKNNHIGRLNLETMEKELIMKGDFKQIHVTENYVFFKDFDDSNTYVNSADSQVNVGTFNPPNLSVTEKK
jgi:hypothetical protein